MLSLFPESQHPLPEFESLLVVGPYHASAPIHLAISFARDNPDSRPMILSPSKTALQASLASLGDSWLSCGSRCGSNLEAVSRIDMLFSPTPVHLCLLLSMLRPQPSVDEEQLPSSQLNKKTTRIFPPGLVILHEPSRYFTSTLDDNSSYTVSSYTALIAQVLAVLRDLKDIQCFPRLVVFDSQLAELKLPVVKAPNPDPFSEVKVPENTDDAEVLIRHVEPFFEMLAVVELDDSEDEDIVPSSQGEEEDILMYDPHKLSVKRMEVKRLDDEEVVKVVRWKETRQTHPLGHDRECIVFDILD